MLSLTSVVSHAVFAACRKVALPHRTTGVHINFFSQRAASRLGNPHLPVFLCIFRFTAHGINRRGFAVNGFITQKLSFGVTGLSIHLPSRSRNSLLGHRWSRCCVSCHSGLPWNDYGWGS